MVRHWCVAVVLCVVGGMTWTDVRGWERHPISCGFKNGTCGWKDSENTTLKWKLHVDAGDFTSDHYMALDMASARVGDIGVLFSPMLHGSSNQTCRLTFKHHIKNDNGACRLAVFLATETNGTLLWMTEDLTGEGLGGLVGYWLDIGLTSETSPYLQGPCTEPSFRIAFVGGKITSESCGDTVDVDDIVFEFSQPDISFPSPTPTTTSVPTTQLSAGNTHVDSDTQASENSTDSEKDKDAALLSPTVLPAVIAVVLAVVIIISLVVIVFFLRRRAQKQGKTDHWTFSLFKKRAKTQSRPHRASAVFTNSQDVPYSGQGQANPESADQARMQSGGDRASVHLYSTAEDHRYSTLDYPRDEHRYSKLDGNRNSTPDDDSYITLVDDVNDGYEIPSPAHHRQTGRSNHDYYNA